MTAEQVTGSKTFFVSAGDVRFRMGYIEGYTLYETDFSWGVVRFEARGQVRPWAAHEWDGEFTDRLFIRELKHYDEPQTAAYLSDPDEHTPLPRGVAEYNRVLDEALQFFGKSGCADHAVDSCSEYELNYISAGSY